VLGAVSALAAQAADAPIKIGFHAALTGPTAADGHSAEIAMRLAVENLNKAGGVNGRPVDLVVYDDQGKPDQVVPIANRLIGEDKVVAVISAGFSPTSKAAAPVFADAHIPYIVALAQEPSLTKAGDYVFRVGNLGEVEGRAAAKLIGEVLKKKRVDLVTMKSDLGHSTAIGFRAVAAKFGVEIVKEYEYSVTDRQFGPLVASIKADAPEIVFATGYYFTGSPLLAQLRAAGVTAQFVGTQPYSSKKFIDIAGPAAEGAIITNVVDWASDDPTTRAFFAEFEKRAGTPTESASSLTYAAAQMLFAAMKAGGTEPKQIRDQLAATSLQTVVGQLSFNKRREVKRAFPVSLVRDGKWAADGVIDDPVLLAPPED
jgi:branched-chain amino acid transport system substrate-binding protein